VNGATIGAVIGAVFGSLWSIAGATALPRRWRACTGALGIGISTVLVGALVEFGARGRPGKFDGEVYGYAVLLEVACIVAAIAVLRRTARMQMAPSAIAFIVGLHFLGLWKATGSSTFIWVAAAICFLSAWSVLLQGPRQAGDGTDPRRALVGLGCAVVLWLAAAAALV